MLGFNNELKKIAEFCGLEVHGQRLGDPAYQMQQHVYRQTAGAKPMADFLLYDYADSKSGLFFNKDGTCGFCYEINPIVGSNEAIEKNLTLFFNDELPENGSLQFSIVANNNISKILDAWERPRVHGSRELKYLTSYRRWFTQKCSRDFARGSEGRLARNFQVFVSYSVKVDGSDKSLQQVTDFQRKLENKLKTEKLVPRLMTPEDLITVAGSILQPDLNRANNKPKYDPLNNLADQICEPLSFARVKQNGIEYGESGLESRSFYVRQLPENFSLSAMRNLLGTSDKVIPANFVISYSLSPLGASGSTAMINQGQRSIHAAEKSYTRHDIAAKEQAREWIEVIDRHKKGEKFLVESMLVTINAPLEQIDVAEESLKSLWNSFDWKLKVNTNLQMLAMLSGLPMSGASYLQSLKYFRLAKNILSGEVVAKLPIQGEWKGVPASGLLLMGICGQLFNFNPYYRIGGGGNYNIALLAPSGAGKSFLLEDLASSLIAQETAMFILDIGASYQNICSNFDGEMIRFNKSNKLSLNPFASLGNSGGEYIKVLEMIAEGYGNEEITRLTGILADKIEALRVGRSDAGAEVKETDGIEILEIRSFDEEGKEKTCFVTKDSIIYAKAMLASMCAVTGDARCEAILERAINVGIERFATNLDITKLAEVLDELKDRKGNPVEGASKLADSLYPYTEHGVHGRFFKAGNKASFDRALTVFEFEELVNDPVLLAVVLQVLLMQITMKFLCGDRSRYFMLIVDEAWMIMDFAASFLERFSRTVRKYGGSLVVCTQDLSSFNKGVAQRAILESSTWKLIMQQNADGISSFAKDEAYVPYLDLIRSVRKCPSNRFSEVLIDTNGVKVIGRLVADPYSTALYSTEREDFNFLMNKERQGVSKHEAILELSRKYGQLPEGLDV